MKELESNLKSEANFNEQRKCKNDLKIFFERIAEGALYFALYFKLVKDSISAYFFIIALENIFTMIKSNPNRKGYNIFNHNCLYTAYAADTTFF